MSPEARLFILLGVYRSEAAKLLGVTVGAVAQWEREGKLSSKPVIVTDERGNQKVRRVLDDDEVAAFKLTYRPTSHNKHRVKKKDRISGERAARAFCIFDRCRDEGRESQGAWEAVKLVRIDPDTAAELWQKWKYGVEGTLEAKRIQELMKTSEREWKAQREERRRQETQRHKERIAQLRKQSPAPIYLSRIVSEATPLSVPANGAPVPKPAEESAPENLPDTGQTG